MSDKKGWPRWVHDGRDVWRLFLCARDLREKRARWIAFVGPAGVWAVFSSKTAAEPLANGYAKSPADGSTAAAMDCAEYALRARGIIAPDAKVWR